jgi:predicted nucleic acid-binding Zn ribbon protein
VNPWAPTEKRCSSCSRILPLEEFPLNRRMHLGRSSHCRECARAATRDWRERNREAVNAERRTAYRAEHPLPERTCAVCGRSFTKRPDAVVCGEECRRQRKREQRKTAA